MLKSDESLCPTDGGEPEHVETLPKGTRLGAYRIEGILGEGGMGFVYEATHEMLGRRTAIKMLRPQLAKVEQIVTRFLNEAKAVNLIAHQNIVNVYDYGDGQDGGVYFVMEFLEGETLDDLMRKRRPMPMALLLHVFDQIAKALAAAHAKQIVHRDLKPGNVFVVAREDNPYFIKLLDFGIAQLRGEGAVQKLTVAGTVMGTPQYMSPEQITGGAVDVRTDVWAFGVMLYRAATGQAPFKGEEFVQLADRIVNDVPQPAGEIVPLPASLSALIASCLERKVEDRCPSASALLAGLGRVKQECGLDDDAILAAVRVETGAITVGLPEPAAQTHGSLGSVQWYKEVPASRRASPPAQAAPPRPQRRSRLGLYMTLGAVAGGITSTLVVLFGGGSPAAAIAPRLPDRQTPDRQTPDRQTPDRQTPDPPPPVPPPPPGKDRFTADDLQRLRALAETHLRAAIASGTLQERGFAVDALALARVREGGALLHEALKGPPDIRVKAARALAELRLPDSAKKVRDALAASGGRIQVELAAALYRLGDKDARTILKRAIEDAGTRLTAALAMAEVGDDAGRAALADILEATPAGREPWRRAAGGLLQLGDENARKLLKAELSQSDAARAVGAAELLARAGDAEAVEQLARHAADRDFARPGEAALALARLGDRRALDWIARGLGSADTEERKLALGICGALAPHAGAHTDAVARRATPDGDLSVRMTAQAALLGLVRESR